MKTVFNNNEVAHRFASQSQEFGRNGNGSFYFERDVIYSYGSHFPIARIITNNLGEKAVVFTTRTYGITTAKHCNDTRRALSHLPLFYCEIPTGSESDVIASYTDRLNKLFKEAKSSRKYNVYEKLTGRVYWGSDPQGGFLNLREEARSYARFIGCNHQQISKLFLVEGHTEEDIQDLIQASLKWKQDHKAKISSPEYQAKLEADREKRNARREIKEEEARIQREKDREEARIKREESGFIYGTD